MINTEFFPGKGFIFRRVARMKSRNVWAVKDPSSRCVEIKPSRESAGSREYLEQMLALLICEQEERCAPFASNKKGFPDSGFTG